MNKINSIFLILFFSTLVQCGFESSSKNSSQLLNKEETNEKDISKSEKTTEKFSESVGEKTREIPGNLLSGFRKSGISSKVNVEGNKPALESLSNTNNLETQKQLDKTLVEATSQGRFFESRALLYSGANPQVAFDKLDDKFLHFKIMALLMLFGAKNDKKTKNKFKKELNHVLNHKLLTLEDIVQFKLDTNVFDFISRSKTNLDKLNLLSLFYSLSHSTLEKTQQDENLLMAVELGDLHAAQNAIRQGADPNLALKHPDLLDKAFHFLPMLVENGASVHTKVDNQTFAEKIILSRDKVPKNDEDFAQLDEVYKYGFDIYFHWSEEQKELNQQLLNSVHNDFLPYSDEVEEWILKGASPNAVMYRYRHYQEEPPGVVLTVLMIAIKSGKLRAAAFLLKHGADSNFEFNGTSAWSLAKKKPLMRGLLTGAILIEEALDILNPEVQQKIINRQKSKENKLKIIQSIWRETSKHINRANNTLRKSADPIDIEGIKLALENGAEITESAFETAIKARNLEAVRLFLKYGADPFLKPQFSERPYDLAVRLNYPEIVEELNKVKR